MNVTDVFPQLVAFRRTLEASLAISGPVYISARGTDRLLTREDAASLKALLDLLLVDIPSKLVSFVESTSANEKTDFSSLRQQVQDTIEPLRASLRDSIQALVANLFSEALDWAVPNTDPLGTLPPCTWRRVDSTFAAIAAITARIEKDLDTLAGLESAFFAEITESVGAVVAAQLAVISAVNKYNNQSLDVAVGKLKNEDASKVKDIYSNAIDSYTNAQGKAMAIGSGDAKDFNFWSLQGPMDQTKANRAGYTLELDTAAVELNHAVAGEIISKARALLAAQVLENRIKTQLDRFVSGGFFSRRRIVRQRIMQDIKEVNLRLQSFRKGLSKIFLLDKDDAWFAPPESVIDAREWLSKLRSIDAYLSRCTSCEYPLRLRVSLCRELQALQPEQPLKQLLAASRIDLAPRLRAACNNHGRIRLRSIGAFYEARSSLGLLSTLNIQPPASMQYGRLEVAPDSVSEPMGPLQLEFLQSSDLAEADRTTAIAPWENISGLGIWTVSVGAESYLARHISEGAVSDVVLVLDLAWWA